MRHSRIDRNIRRKKNRAAAFIIIVAAAILAAGMLFERHAAPLVGSYARISCTEEVTRLMTETIASAIDEAEGSSGLMNTACTSDGGLQLISADPIKVNRLKNDITNKLCEKLSDSCSCTVTIPAGSLLGSRLAGFTGWDVKLDGRITGTVSSEFRSVIEDCGSGRSVHRLYIVITADTLVSVYGENACVPVSTEILVSETVIPSDTEKKESAGVS